MANACYSEIPSVVPMAGTQPGADLNSFMNTPSMLTKFIQYNNLVAGPSNLGQYSGHVSPYPSYENFIMDKKDHPFVLFFLNWLLGQCFLVCFNKTCSYLWLKRFLLRHHLIYEHKMSSFSAIPYNVRAPLALCVHWV